jgi:hypothetical protein
MNIDYSATSNPMGCSTQKQQMPVSPNLFHNPISSGLNSTKHASPMLNYTANFAG